MVVVTEGRPNYSNCKASTIRVKVQVEDGIQICVYELNRDWNSECTHVSKVYKNIDDKLYESYVNKYIRKEA